jgi:uncharacterized protein (TIGR03435 family)
MSTAAGIIACLGIAALYAQQPQERRFDVVAIRAVPKDAPQMLRSADFDSVLPGGQFVDPRTSLLFIIAFAYRAKPMRISGLPDWAQQTPYSISAKPAPGFPVLPASENSEQVRLMMRSMLAERFHLQLHTETRQEPVYNLEVAKGGMKLQEVEPPTPPAKPGNVGAAIGNNDGRMIGKKSTTERIAVALEIFLNRTVIDKTALNGHYDFDIKWSDPTVETPPGTGLGPSGISLMISNLRDQLGLQLSKSTGPVTYWMVDRVEHPTEN